jgi:hypothetical protein
VDDRSGVAYQEYHGVYGEDVEAALRFLFAAMAPKALADFPFQGIPQMIYMDNGPLARSRVFQQVMRYLLHYNTMQHRSDAHSRFEDWLRNLPPSGLRAMCDWERYCTFAREPERRQVGIDARILVDGTTYAVDPELAGETVVLWWGLFDQDLYVEHNDRRYGPYHPVTGPIPLHRYRRVQKTTREKRTERIEALAHQLTVPHAALDGGSAVELPEDLLAAPMQSFVDPDPCQEFTFPTRIAAKLAIADYLGMPLATLPPQQLEEIERLLGRTLHKQEVFAYVRTQIQPTLRR